MQKNLFPSQISGLTTEHFLSRHSNKSQVVYSAIVFAVMVVIALLPILKVDVSVQANGIIRPVCEKNEIKSLVSGTISEIFVSENQSIAKNEMLLKLETRVIKEKLRVNAYRLSEEENYLHDYRMVVSNYLTQTVKSTPLRSEADLGGHLVWSHNKVFCKTSYGTNIHLSYPRWNNRDVPPKIERELSASLLRSPAATFEFKTRVCLREWLLFINKLKENSVKQEETNKEIGRLRPLFDKNIISKAELEKKEFEIKQLKIQKEALEEQKLGKWHSELLSRNLKLNQLRAEREQLQNEKKLSAISSPVTGTIEQFSGLSVGSYVQAGQTLAVISPDSDLIAEMYVAPKDIGLIKKSAKANFQVDAFDYNQWGMLKGKIESISDDFLQFDNQPMFRVRCKLDKNFLQLKNGYKGQLKKGMTLRSRFLVARRSLFQLLYDKVDDWLNPATN